jgi:hypothetical protein
MNERLKELAEQAGFVDFTVHNRIESKEQVLEKFAELLIKECTAINLKVLSFTAYALLYEKYCEHFGVEE